MALLLAVLTLADSAEVELSLVERATVNTEDTWRISWLTDKSLIVASMVSGGNDWPGIVSEGVRPVEAVARPLSQIGSVELAEFRVYRSTDEATIEWTASRTVTFLDHTVVEFPLGRGLTDPGGKAEAFSRALLKSLA